MRKPVKIDDRVFTQEKNGFLWNCRLEYIIGRENLKFAVCYENGCLGLAIFFCEYEDEVEGLTAGDTAVVGGVMEHSIKTWREALEAKML